MPVLIAAVFAVSLLIFVLLPALSARRFPLGPFVCVSAGALLSVAFLEFLPRSFAHPHPHAMGAALLCGLLIQGAFDLYGVKRLKFLDGLLLPPARAPAASSSAKPAAAGAAAAGGGASGDQKKAAGTLEKSGAEAAKSKLQAGRSAHAHVHAHTLSPSGVCSLVGCLTVCSFFDGIRLFSGLLLNSAAAAMTAFSLFFHLASQAIIVAVLGADAGIRQKAVFVLALFMTGFFVAGAALADGALSHFPEEGLIAFSSGTLIYICFAHLLPVSLQKANQKWLALGLLIASLPHFFH